MKIMAIVSDPEGRGIRGKTNKKSKEVHRMRNGREFVYSIENPYDGPASKAQKNHRSIFGKTNAIVNRIMADPEQVQEWQAKMEEYKRTAMPYATPGWKPFRTVRQYIYSVISEQLKNKPAARRRKANLPIILPRGVRLQIKAFSDLKAAEIYESDNAGVYNMCKKDYPDVLAELEKEPFTDLLDCGCGTGPMISLLYEKYPEKNYTGIDLTPKMIEVAKRKKRQFS